MKENSLKLNHQQMIAWLTLEGWIPTKDNLNTYPGAYTHEHRVFNDGYGWRAGTPDPIEYSAVAWEDCDPTFVNEAFKFIMRTYHEHE
jgi:hypothetical protein